MGRETGLQWIGLALGALLCGSTATAQEWPTFGGDYGNRRFSELDQITPQNVANLEPAWRIHTGIAETFQATPIVRDGVIYLSTPRNHVLALDATTGAVLWRYEHQSRWEQTCCGPANRGVALGQGKVYMGTIDARLIALDRRTGAPLWDFDLAAGIEAALPVEGVDPAELSGTAAVTGNTGITANSAALYWDGRVFQGISGVGYGVHLDDGSVQGVNRLGGNRGFLVAVDAESGEELWRWYSIRDRDWEGSFAEKTAYGAPLGRDAAVERAAAGRHRDSWRTGGASVWNTPAIDPETRTLFVGTGNPSPQMAGDLRPGDNLDSVSLVALKADTGERRWAYQYVPHDVWGYDAASPALLFDFPRGESTVPAVGHASKTGSFFVHERETGALLLASPPFVPTENLFAAIGETPTRIAPGAAGGANWNPPALHPRLRRVFVPAMHFPFEYFRKRGDGARPDVVVGRPAPGSESYGLLSALDLATGEVVWSRRSEEPTAGGVLATASGLVFYTSGDGSLRALDAGTGELLWTFQAQAGFSAPPITYQAGGRQILLVAAGGSQLFGTPLGDEVLAFALPAR